MTSKVAMVSTYPVRSNSSSAPYIFACHVPHPSSQRRGIILAKRPLNVGLRYNDTLTRSGNALRRGESVTAVFPGPGLVDRK